MPKLFLCLWAIVLSPMVFTDPWAPVTVFEGEAGDFFFRQYQKVREKQRPIHYSPDLRWYQIFREREFQTEKYVTVVATTEYRNGWPFFAEVILKVGNDLREAGASRREAPRFSGIFDERILQIWQDPKQGLKRFSEKYPQLYAASMGKIKQLVRNGNGVHLHRLREWSAFVEKEYKRREWFEEFDNFLAATLVADRKRSDWGVVYERLDPAPQGASAKGEIIGTIMKTKSEYWRFLIDEKKPDGDHRRTPQTLICKINECELDGILPTNIQPADELALEKLTETALPRMANMLSLDFPLEITLEGKTYTVLAGGRGEISEDRCFVIRKRLPRRPEEFVKVFGDTWVHLLFFMTDPENPTDVQHFNRSYAYAPLDERGKSGSIGLYEKLGLMEEVFPVIRAKALKTVDLNILRFSYGPQNIRNLVLHPEKYRPEFANAKPDLLLEAFARLIAYEQRAGAAIKASGEERFYTYKRIGKILMLLASAGLLAEPTLLAKSKAAEELLRSLPEVQKHLPNATISGFVQAVQKAFSHLRTGIRRDVFKQALQHYGIAWQDVFTVSPVNEEEAAQLLADIAQAFPNISFDKRMFEKSGHAPLIENMIYEKTGKRRSITAFVRDISTLRKGRGGWNRFLKDYDYEVNLQNIQAGFSEEETKVVILGFLERLGTTGSTGFKDRSQRKKFHAMIAEILPHRPKEFCTLGRFQKALQKFYGNFSKFKQKFAKEYADAEKRFTTGKRKYPLPGTLHKANSENPLPSEIPTAKPNQLPSEELCRTTLHELDEKNLLGTATEFMHSQAVTDYLRSRPGFPPTITAKSFYVQLVEVVRPHLHKYNLDEREKFKAALQHFGIDWRKYHLDRQLDLWEVVVVLRDLIIHHSHEINFTGHGFLSINRKLFDETLYKLTKSKNTPRGFVGNVKRVAGSWYGGIFVAGFEPENFNGNTPFLATMHDQALRSIFAELWDKPILTPRFFLPEILPSILMQKSLDPSQVLKSQNQLQTLGDAIERQLGQRPSNTSLVTATATLAHGIDLESRWGDCFKLFLD